MIAYRKRAVHTIRLILKTIGNRKGDCAWSCSRWQTQPEKICKSQRTNQCHSLRTLYWFVRCDLQIFSGCVCHLEQLHAQSPFLFPIVFSINLIPFFDICSVDYLLFFHPGCSGMCCFTWAAARSQQYTLLSKRQASCLYNHALEHSTGSERVDVFGLREMVGILGKSRQAHQQTAGSPANAKLTFRYPSSLINHSTLLLERSSAKLLVFYASTRSRRAVEVIICMITRDFSVISIDVTGVSLSLSLSLSLLLTKVTHAQYRKRFRVSYNKCKRPDRLSNQFGIIWYALWLLPGQIFMTTGHFRQQKARLVEQRIQLFFFFRWLLPCQYFLDNWTLLSFSLLGVYIDQSSSSQIHPKCSLGQDSPNMWNEARFTKSVKWAKLWDFDNNSSIFF